MTTEIIASIITGGCTLMGALITHFLLQRIELGIYAPAGAHRNLSGKWAGETKQENGQTAILTSCFIKSRRKTLRGTLIVEYGEHRLNIRFKGYYIDNDHIITAYTAVDHRIKNFGSQILNINSNCDKLSGYTIGHGNLEEELIRGNTVLKKII